MQTVWSGTGSFLEKDYNSKEDATNSWNCFKAMFDENVYGKYPAHIPAVTWKVDSVEQMTVQGIPAIVKHITGHVDNSAYPAITVDIHADVVTPASTKGTKGSSV